MKKAWILTIGALILALGMGVAPTLADDDDNNKGKGNGNGNGNGNSASDTSCNGLPFRSRIGVRPTRFPSR